MSHPTPSKAARTTEFFRRLAAAPPANNQTEAYEQLCDVLNQVEDELTSIPFDPSMWQIDGRMYPPQEDNKRLDPANPDVVVFRSAGHLTRIAQDGSIEIQDRKHQTMFSKPGKGH